MGCGTLSKSERNKSISSTSIFEVKFTNINSTGSIEDPNGDSGVCAVYTVDSLQKQTDPVQLYLFKADHYFKYGAELKHVDYLESMRIIRKALNDYTLAYELNKANTDAVVGIARSFMKLHQYRKALLHLDKAYKQNKVELSELAIFWLMYGKCYRKCAKVWDLNTVRKRDQNGLESAKNCFHKGSTIEPENRKIQKQSRIVDRLIAVQNTYEKNFENYIESMKACRWTYECEGTYRKPDRKTYKILAIDGGGLRACVPALILSEIEKRSRKYLTDLFDMFAGTSAGGFLAGCLTVTENVDSLKPLYSTYNTLDILVRKAHNVFPNPSNLRRFYSEKYSTKSSKRLADDTFKDMRLGQTLKHLIIPAVNYDGPLRTVYFRNYDEKQKKLRIKDVLMATTAAPSFYRPHKIHGLGYFVDGALTTPNPCKKAYEEAVYHFHNDPSNVYALSLGTGTNMSTDESTSDKGLIHWVSNMSRYMITSQTHDTDIFMQSKLHDRFKRFELYYENTMPMDSYVHVPDLVEIATEYIEEKHDDINKIVEVLLNN